MSAEFTTFQNIEHTPTEDAWESTRFESVLTTFSDDMVIKNTPLTLTRPFGPKILTNKPLFMPIRLTDTFVLFCWWMCRHLCEPFLRISGSLNLPVCTGCVRPVLGPVALQFLPCTQSKSHLAGLRLSRCSCESAPILPAESYSLELISRFFNAVCETHKRRCIRYSLF